MDFKPFPIYVGYNRRVTEYEQGMHGKVPAPEVMNWLAEVGIEWQFEWRGPEATDPDPGAVFEMMAYVEQVNKNIEKGGGIFYFDNEEDRLLFCLTWVANGIKQDAVMWHPV
jgi:hypothetical protein